MSIPVVIPDAKYVIPAPDQVRGFNIRDPVPRRYWIADQVRNDNGGRNDNGVCNDKEGRNDNLHHTCMFMMS